MQTSIFDAVSERGYGPTAQGISPEQYAARQLCKAIEEALEALGAVALPAQPDFMRTREVLERQFKYLFDDPVIWRTAVVDRDELIAELADVLVPLNCAAEALGVDGQQLALDKATADVQRGVRAVSG